MGIPAEVMSIRVTEERRKKIVQMQQALTPMVRNRNHLFDLMIDEMHARMFVWGMMRDVLSAVQRLLGMNAYYEGLPSSEVREHGGVADRDNVTPPSLRPRRPNYDPLLLSPKDAGRRDNRRAVEEMAWSSFPIGIYWPDSQFATAGAQR